MNDFDYSDYYDYLEYEENEAKKRDPELEAPYVDGIHPIERYLNDIIDKCELLSNSIQDIRIEACGDVLDTDTIYANFENVHKDVCGNEYKCICTVHCPRSILSNDPNKVKDNLLYFKEKLRDIEEFRLESKGKTVYYNVDYINKKCERNNEDILLYSRVKSARN